MTTAKPKPAARSKAKKRTGTPRPTAIVPTRWPVGEDGLTDRQRRFVTEVQVDWNYTQAAIRAGYGKSDARNTGSDLMKNPKITSLLKERDRAAIVASGVNKSWVLKRLVDEHTAALKFDTLAGVDRRLKSLELIGRHRDVDAFRVNGGVIPDPTGDGGDWDLQRLDDDELAIFERLLAKITTDPDASPGGTGASASGSGPASDVVEQGSDSPPL